MRWLCPADVPSLSPNAEIGQALHLSLSSVKAHIGRLMDKIGARNRVQIAIWAHQTGQTDH